MENTHTTPNSSSKRRGIMDDLNPEQFSAATHPKGPLLIVAGAGTGKTTVITRRIAHLMLNQGVKGNEILALTFTNKAAEEMEERLDKLLPYGYTDLWVSTFHTFCQRILEAHGMDIGISSAVELLDGTGQWLLVRQNLDKFDLDYYRPRNNPTKFIKAVLTHFSRLKDEEISTEQYLEYAEGLRLSGDDAESSGGKSPSLVLSFTQHRASADDVELSRTQHQADEKRRIVEIANAYHTYQELLHKNNKMDFGDLINYCLQLFRDRPNVLSEYQKQFKYILVDEFQDTNWAQYELVRMLALPENNITVVADDDQSIYRFRGASMSNVIQFSKDYKDAAKVSLIRNYRSGQEILDCAYDFIQLNNPNRLEASFSRHPERNDEPKGRGMESKDLSESRLSIKDGDPSAASAGADSARDDMMIINKKLIANTKEKAQVTHLHCRDASSEARIVAETILSLKEKDKTATWNDFVILVRANSQAEEFAEMLATANIPHQNYSAVGLYKTSLVMNILVFFKVLDDYHESRALFRLLCAPFLKIAAEDIVKLNHHSYKKRVSLYEAIQKPQISGVSNETSLSEIERVRSWIASYSEKALHGGGQAKQDKPTRLLLDWMNQGYMQYLAGLPDGESQEQFRLLKAFYDHLKQIEMSFPDSRVHDMVDILDQEIVSGDAGSLPVDAEAGPEMVKVMTIHSAKGLEFKYVFVANMVDRRFPTIERSETIKIPDDLVKEVVPEGDVHIEEERRLFYVAMTRAKQGLFFTSAENYGGAQKKKLSRFLIELKEVHNKFEVSNSVLGGRVDDFIPKILYQAQKEFKVILPRLFSFTQLKIFDECPFAYKMQFLLKVPLPGKFVFSYGTTMHSTLQQFMQILSGKQHSEQASLFGQPSVIASEAKQSYRRNEQGFSLGDNQRGDKIATVASTLPPATAAGRRNDIPSVDELLSLYEKNWIDDWYDSAAQMKEYKQKGKQALKDFYTALSAGPIPNVKALERGFKLCVGEYTIMGKMDRVDSVSVIAREGTPEAKPARGWPHFGRQSRESNNMCVRIVDYKTGAVPKEGKLSLSDKRQLLIYQIAAEEVFREKVEKLVYYYLDQGEQIEFVGSEEEKQEVKQWVIDTIEAIKSHNFALNPKQHFCDYCDEFRDFG